MWGKLWFKLPFTSKVILSAFYLFEQFILKLPFSYFIAVSHATADRLVENGIKREKIKIIYNGLKYDLFSKFKHDPPEKFTYCYFGRLGISKGLDILLYASKDFLEKDKEATLRLIIPTYPEGVYKQVMRIIDELGIMDRIELLHDLPKEVLLEKVRTSSCVVIPSHSEGFCYTAAETVAMGIPVISSDKGSLKEVISGKCLKLKELTRNDLFEALLKAYDNEWETVEDVRFPYDDTISNYLDLYKEITER